METTNLQPQNFKSFLQEELIKRCRNNKNYSLRAFAKSLGIGPSSLTEMLHGKRPITKKSIEKLGLSLGLSTADISNYLAIPIEQVEVSAKQASYRQINLDQYSVISDWYHYAIIELLKVVDFRPDNAWIAQALSITKSEANIAVERLIRLHLIEQDSHGYLVDTSAGFSTNISENLTSSGSRQLQKQILEQAIDALENVPLKLRNQTSMTMAIDPALIPEAIKKITKFRRELCEYLETQGTQQEVYQLSVSLFPITQIKKLNNLNQNGENV